jgi:hypothetical protein
MQRLVVEGWAPDYGGAVDAFDELQPVEGSVDTAVEATGWAPIAGRDDDHPVVAFVDGVRRIDARLVLDTDAGPIPGLCGSYGVGAVVWDRRQRRAEIVERRIERIAVLAKGRIAELPPIGSGLVYRGESVPDEDPASLVRHFHGQMRLAEAHLADRLAGDGLFVVADGPLYEPASSSEQIGFVKSHRVSYLAADHAGIVGSLAPGERTPLFTIKDYERYSWYLCLARYPGGHSWTGIARCEAPGGLPKERVAAIADRTAAVLPAVASEPHLDPRAPQNLVPIAALERDLRHRLGDQGLVLRALRTALTEAAA